MEKWQQERNIIINTYLGHHPQGNADLINKAFDLAVNAHQGQMRQSGEEYITHPIGVAVTVAKLGLDEGAIAAALCHDTVEDCATTLEDVTRELGADVAKMVDGVTKLEKVKTNVAKSQQNAEAKAATLRKLLVAVADDVRVLIIKLCDRLHNVDSLGILPEAKAKRIAAETLEVYAPLAHRLGMSELKWQLEDKSFAALHPERYQELKALVEARSPERDRRAGEAVDHMQKALKEANIGGVVDGRAKHYWSIYSKMARRNKSFDEIFDLLGVRIIVNTVAECYSALGVAHALYPPVPGRFKDYIAQPKFNSYSAIHTSVVGPRGKIIELQIRTREMHERAEVGIAAHWSYKDGQKINSQEPSWLTRLLDVHEETDDPNTFLASVREDLAGGEVVCFTPKGECITLAAGSSPIDFAYAIHTQIGHATFGAKVNGKLVPLSTTLNTGDSVEVLLTSAKDPAPRAEWLSFAVTSKAKGAIRSQLHKAESAEKREEGKNELIKALSAERLPVGKTLDSSELLSVAASYHLSDVASLLSAIGGGEIESKEVAQKAKTLLDVSGGVRIFVPEKPLTVARYGEDRQESLHAEGLTDLTFHLAACCMPEPGDDVMGYITKERGVSVHKEECTNVPDLLDHKARCIDVEWTVRSRGSFYAHIEVEGIDRSGLLADVTRAMSEMGGNVKSCSVATDPDLVAHQTYEVELADEDHLNRILKAVQMVDGVYKATTEKRS